MELFRPSSDTRPESFKVNEDSIGIVRRGKDVSRRAKVELWRPFVTESLSALEAAQKTTGQSLGIVKPDPGSVRFHARPLAQANDEERAAAESIHSQQLLLEEPLKNLPRSEYVFSYGFTSGDRPHKMQIHDWEVQAAWINYRQRYGDKAMDHLRMMYAQTFPSQHLHFLMGTMAARPSQFMIIGLLRTTEDFDALDAQHRLF